MSSPPSPTGSPVHKRVRADEPAPATSGTATPVAAVKAEPSSPKRTPLIKSALPNKGKGKRKRNRHKLPDPFSSGDVLYRDVVDFLGKEYTAEVLARGDDSDWAAPENLEYLSTVELTVGAMTVSGGFELYLTS
jgi:tRNA (uracil-5-)-methyltransferase